MPENSAVRDGAIASDKRIRDVLRKRIQRALDSRTFTRKELAEDSGVNIHTIDAILSHDVGKHRRVACEDAFCLAYSLGEDAVSKLIGVIGFTAQRKEADEIAPAQIVASILPHVASIATAAADGRFDHTERPVVQDAADQIIATVLPLSSAGGR